MIEVHSGTRPGKPRLLLLLSAGVLVASLGLAWFQARSARQLGPEQEIPGTPLRVRVPQRWLADPNEPGSFVLPVARTRGGRQYFDADRRIRFEYARWPAFEPLAEQLSTVASGGFEPEPARIGRFDAVQLRQVVRRRWGMRPEDVKQRETVLRVACLPGGQFIKVTYIPMTDLTLADLRLFEDVCATIRIDEPAIGVTSEEALAHAGVRFTVSRDSVLTLPYLTEVPGLFLGGRDNGFPAWSVAVLRTWLAPDRTPRDLLLDFAATTWILPEDSAEVREWKRADGTAVATIRQPATDTGMTHPVASVWVVAESPGEAVMLLVYTNEAHLRTADEAVGHIADEIAIDPLPIFSDLPAAETAGQNLARLLTAKGALPWWGQRKHEMEFRRVGGPREEAVTLSRRATPGSSRYAYEGDRRRYVAPRELADDLRWTIDDHATAYAFEHTTRLNRIEHLVAAEKRDGDGAVRRVVGLDNDVLWSGTFEPGRSFVCPPIEPVAEAWVAGQEKGQWLLEVATPFGRAAHTRLLVPLPGASGVRRTLLLDDYRPLGMVRGFDDGGEPLYWREAATRYERIR